MRTWTAFIAVAAFASLLATLVTAAPFGIVTVSPTGVTPADVYVNFTLTGGRVGHKLFLMLPKEPCSTVTFNCTKPPTFGSKMRTPEVTIGPRRTARVLVSGLVPGDYIICYRNMTADPTNHTYIRPGSQFTSNQTWRTNLTMNGTWRTNHTVNTTRRYNHTINETSGDEIERAQYGVMEEHERVRYRSQLHRERRQFFVKQHVNRVYYTTMKMYNFVQLAPIVKVADPRIDAGKSSVCCHGPFVAGYRVTCTITAVDSEGRITGTAADACRFNLCPLQDGRGQDVKQHLIEKPFYVKTGEYKFSFIPVGSGCAGVAGVGFDGMSLSNKYAFFKVQPNPTINVTKATSQCVVDDHTTGDTTCYIVQRDVFGNPVKRCTVDPQRPPRCFHITH